MLNGKISILNNSRGEPAFPITSSRAVYMGNGTTVEDSINSKSDKEHKHLKSDISDWPNDIATETFVTNAIADAQLTGEGNLSNYATKIELSTKVDKVVGKSLISDTEIERLLTLENYDDSSIRSSLNNITTELSTKVDKVEGKSLISDTEIERLSTLVNYDDSSIRSSLANITTSLENITTNYATKTELSTKVDKVDGKSLISDTEIKRLLTLKNYDDTSIRSSLTDITTSLEDITTNYATKTFVTDAIAEAQLNGGGNSADLSDYATKTELASKVDKVEGKSLILDTEIERLSTLVNYDDSSIRSSLNDITTNYATKTFVTNAIAEAQLNGDGNSVDLSSYATKTELASKVDKVDGKSLILDTEIERLSTLVNYDDSSIRSSLNNITTNYATKTELSTKVDKVSGKSLILDTEIERLSTLVNYDDSSIRSSLNDITTNYATKTELSTKVDKVNGKSLISDTEITRLSTLVNYDDSSIRSSLEDITTNYATKTELSTKVDKVNGKSLISDIEITRLSTLVNYDDSSIRSSLEDITTNYATKAELVSKVDKVNGQSLVPDSEIKRLLTLKNYDDTFIRSSLTEIKTNQGNLTDLLTTNKTDLVQAINELYRMVKGDSTEEVKTVTLDKTTAVISVNGTTTITATITPSSPADKDVTWSCDNNNVTLNDNGLTCTVTGAKVGTSIVTFRTADGYTAICTITVVSSSASGGN